MPEIGSTLVMAIATVAAGVLLGRAGLGAAALWVCAWLALILSGILGNQLADGWVGQTPVSMFFSDVLGTAFSALLLAGVYHRSRGGVPAWLLPAALAVCVTRGALAAQGLAVTSAWLGLAVEPPALLLAAGILLRASGPRRIVWLFAASMVLAALLEVVVSIGEARELPTASVIGPAVLIVLLVTSMQALGGYYDMTLRLGKRSRDRRRAESALGESLERFDAITTNGFDLISELDLDLRVTWLSPNYAPIYGIEPAAFIGRSALDFVHPDDRERLEAGLRSVVGGAPAWHGTIRARTEGGAEICIESAVRLYESPVAGRRLISSARDVTERMRLAKELRQTQEDLERRVEERTAALAAANDDLRRQVVERQNAEQALRLSQDRYRNTSELVTDYAYEVVFDPDTGDFRRPWVTGAFEQITGYRPNEAQDIGWTQLTHPEDLPRLAECFQRAIRGERAEVQYRITAKDGSQHWISERMRAVRDEVSGKMVVYGAAHDVTAQKESISEHQELEARMRESQKLESLGVLAGGIAHDFNNMLTVILGNTAIALRDLSEESPIYQRLERISKAAEYAVGLTEQMLTYAGGAAYALKSLDLSRVVEDMTALLESSLAPGVRVVTDFPPRLPVVEGDETQVRQIVMNLITNAREALAERGGTIRVSTGIVDADADLLADAYPAGDRSPGSYAYLEVSDDGPGIDDETRERIFEPFFSTKFSGRGLGLAAVLGIVRGHRAAICLETGPESGTTFRVLFPLRAAAEALPVAAEEPAPGRGGLGSVLVIDDDEAVLEVSREFLRRAGLSVVLARSGREGLRILEEDGGIGAVLLDFQMPDLDGVDVLREIRRLRPHLPVLVVTGYAEEIAAQRVAAGEFTSYIQKPYDPDVLVHRVQDALAGADAD